MQGINIYVISNRYNGTQHRNIGSGFVLNFISILGLIYCNLCFRIIYIMNMLGGSRREKDFWVFQHTQHSGMNSWSHLSKLQVLHKCINLTSNLNNWQFLIIDIWNWKSTIRENIWELYIYWLSKSSYWSYFSATVTFTEIKYSTKPSYLGIGPPNFAWGLGPNRGALSQHE